MEPPLAPCPLSTTFVSTTVPAAQKIVLTEMSLSSFFPVGTQYFYGYPSGEHSGFFNADPPFIEELDATRTLSCAGPWVTPVAFASGADSIAQKILREDFGAATSCQQPFVLPLRINETLRGPQRNRLIVHTLAGLLSP
jgi:hypothetical protein